LAASGDTTAALRSVRSRWYFSFYAPYLATHLREESAYALAVGDTANAVWALRRYLAMRVASAPEVANDVAQARSLLAAITRTSSSLGLQARR
jgi:hypothetical protein